MPAIAERVAAPAAPALIHPLAVVGAALLQPVLYGPVGRYLLTVWRDFFFPQYRLRWWRRDRPVYRIDGPLDDRIPFRPELYPKYLSFVALWLRTLGFVWRHGGDRSLPRLVEFVAGLDALYREAGAVSRAFPTTTRRPKAIRGLRMFLVKAVDPHYHCLPSLHIAVVLYTYLKFSEWLPSLGGAAAEAWQEHVRREAVSISESVLYTKQHSVSCIGAALYFLSVRFPAAGGEFAERYLQWLFAGADDVPAEEIRAAIRSMYLECRRCHGQGDREECRRILADFIRREGMAE